MRKIRLAAGLVLLFGLSAPAGAVDCDFNDKALGVSRTVEIDATGGPTYGDQYPDTPSFLNDGEVVLTFDDGPMGERTVNILNMLSAECTKATFFQVGEMAIAYPGVAREVGARGNTIASHTWSHAWLSHLGESGAEQQIEKGMSAVAAVQGKPISPFFRFPFLADPRSMITYLKGRNVAVFGIDVDSRDTRSYRPDHLVSWTIAELKRLGKGLILMHDIRANTEAALPELLQQLKASHFKVVHLVPRQTLVTDAETDQAIGKLLAARALRLSKDEEPPVKATIATKVATLPPRDRLLDNGTDVAVVSGSGSASAEVTRVSSSADAATSERAAGDKPRSQRKRAASRKLRKTANAHALGGPEQANPRRRQVD